MNELHLKFKVETGTSATTDLLRDDDDHYVEVASDEYLSWLEDLAEKYLKGDMSGYSNKQIGDEYENRKHANVMSQIVQSINSRK